MSFANFGIGLGALAQGLNTGIDAGTKLKGIMDQNQIRKAHKEGMAKAKDQRQSAIDGLVQVGAAPNADNTMTMPTYEVEGQSFGDEESARKAAESKVGTVTDYFYQNEAPRIAELYMEQGDLQKAETWNKWIKDKNVQKGFEYGVRAYQAASLGDDEGAIKSMIKMYNHPGYFEDGRKATGYEPIKGEGGETVGYAITVEDDKGNKNILNVERGQGMLQAIAPFVDPKTVYDQGWSEINAMNKAKLEMAKEERKFKRDIALEDRKETGRVNRQEMSNEAALNRTVTGKQMDAASRQAIERMRQQGDALYKKNTHPDEAVKQLVLAEKKAQATNPYGPQRTDAEIVEEARQTIQSIYSTQRSPMSGGIKPQGATPSGTGPMIYDTKTGKLVPYQR